MELLDLIVKQIRDFNKPIIPVIDVVGFDEPGEGNIVRHLDAMGIMAYSSPEQAIRALAKAEGYYRKRRAENIGVRCDLTALAGRTLILRNLLRCG